MKKVTENNEQYVGLTEKEFSAICWISGLLLLYFIFTIGKIYSG